MQATRASTELPFTMLVWGVSGSGKSSWCMRFLHVIDTFTYKKPVSVYCSAEEDVDGQTVQHRQSLTGLTTAKFINRLPSHTAEWKTVLRQKHPTKQVHYRRKFLVIDSVSTLGITPYFFEEECEDRYERLPEDSTQNLGVWDFVAYESALIFIAHATKDGVAYIGTSDWAHEVDIVIQCVQNGGRGAVDSTMNIW